MEASSKPVELELTAKKSPLQSKTLALGVVVAAGGVIARFNPEVGEWVKTNADTVLLIVGTLVGFFRPSSTTGIDWKNWTVKGFGIKF